MKTTTFLLSLLMTFSIYINAQNVNPKHVNYYKAPANIETSDYKIELSNIVSKIEYAKLSIKIYNTGTDYLMFNKGASEFVYKTGKFTDKEKYTYILPTKSKTKTIKATGSNMFHTDTISFVLKALYIIPAKGEIVKADDFKLPASKNSFELGNFKVKLLKLKQETQETYAKFEVLSLDIRDADEIESLFKEKKFDYILHTAAQPSHDWAAKEPLTDFSVNANGTIVLLEAMRKYSPNAVFLYVSTNKVYGDRPNEFNFIELDMRYELPQDHKYYNGFNENLPIDQCLHSLFGVSKLSADLMVQEYGRYFNLKTGVFRGGCLTGALHSGVELHGFLSYLVKSIVNKIPYTVYGHNGKQVRDNIHSYDFVNASYHFFENPKIGVVYNIGGSRVSNISMKEAISKIENITGVKGVISYSEKTRIGDHIWYISDVSKLKRDYPDWDYSYNIDKLLEEICKFEMA